MRLEFIPFIILLSLLAIQYFLAKRRVTVAGKTATVVEGESQTTTSKPDIGRTIIKSIKEFTENEERFWLLGFIVVVVIMILLYTVLDNTGSDRWKTVGLITLVGIHVFIFWNFSRALIYKDKLHPATKFFVGACLIFWTIALFVPHFAEWAVTGMEETRRSFDVGFDPKTKEKEKMAQQSARKAPQAVLKTTTQTLHLEPGGNNFRKVRIPYGTRVIESVEWSCEDGCIIEAEHDMNRLCEIAGGTEREGSLLWSLGTYQGAKCRVATIPSSPGVIRYREQFLVPIGADNNNFFLPDNLIHVITSFGTNEVMGPRDIIVSAVTSS